MRKSAIRRIMKSKGQLIPNYNPEACLLIDRYGKQHGYNFKHAENGGEYYIEDLGYWVDGYDSNQNVVIECDEVHHFRNDRLRTRDKTRQREIENFLDCKFIRVKVGV